jgi:hypothetical protein
MILDDKMNETNYSIWRVERLLAQEWRGPNPFKTEEERILWEAQHSAQLYQAERTLAAIDRLIDDYGPDMRLNLEEALGMLVCKLNQ